ncbi:hypothetical protein DNTS_011988 [Danionella cerebrum]|uniref:Fas apoptotic inhibitory molecule 1 n=1 Tax=Danionella cerebrum TaxID=2873325 RepID=A0A553RPS9_9TELE|nr:hypothetical protein DNTS_011988 [Danionella translucida]
MSGDIVGVWDVALSDGVYRIEFEHGTTTGKRVIYINGKEVLRRDWMFKLVGSESFHVGCTDTKATITIEAITNFSYEYNLEVNGKSLQSFLENRSKMSKTWLLKRNGADYRIVLEKDTLDVWCNGNKMEAMGEFTENGSETHFAVGSHQCCITAAASGRKRKGMVHSLLVDGVCIEEATE